MALGIILPLQLELVLEFSSPLFISSPAEGQVLQLKSSYGYIRTPEVGRRYHTWVPYCCLLHQWVTSSAFAVALLKWVQLWIHQLSGKTLSVSCGQALPGVWQYLRVTGAAGTHMYRLRPSHLRVSWPTDNICTSLP